MAGIERWGKVNNRQPVNPPRCKWKMTQKQKTMNQAVGAKRAVPYRALQTVWRGDQNGVDRGGGDGQRTNTQ